MIEAGEQPFIIEARSGGLYEVLVPHDSNKLMQTKHRQLGWLMQAEEWEDLKPDEQVMAKALYDDISLLGRTLNAHLDSLDQKFNRLSARLRQGIQDGRVTPWSPEMQPGLAGTGEPLPISAVGGECRQLA
jgi:hypothetical protein